MRFERPYTPGYKDIEKEAYEKATEKMVAKMEAAKKVSEETSMEPGKIAVIEIDSSNIVSDQ